MQPNIDPFEKPRRENGVIAREFRGEKVRLLLRHDEVREAAKDWERYSSNEAFRVPVPSEEYLRTVRQIPLETDPPEHAEYRRVMEPFFKRVKEPEMIVAVNSLMSELLDAFVDKGPIDLVENFALPYQCRALALLLRLPESEAQVWIDFGINVFLGGAPGEQKGAKLEHYLNTMLDKAEANPGEDFFSALTRAKFRGRQLTREEMLGYAILTFSGGRDTVIHACTSALAYLAAHPEALDFLRADPSRVALASEELFRVISPLTHLGRVCTHSENVHGETVERGERISLCWASANFDEAAFPDPQKIKLDRKPNPHVAFGAGIHVCIGAPHARLLLRTLLEHVSRRLLRLEIVNAIPHQEEEPLFNRYVGYDQLVAKLLSKAASE